MKVKDMLAILSEFPADEEISVIYPEDHYGEDNGVDIDEVTYLKSSDSRINGVFIRLG